jgi:pimeloyl-ACP methyl ester carboxylesterase
MTRGYASTLWGQVHYQDAGSGTPVLMIPGGGQSHLIFDREISVLSERHRVILIDLLGHGYSDPVPEGATFELLAESLVHVLDSLGIDKAHIYGANAGNKIGAALAVNWPERVAKFIFLGNSHSIIPDMAERNEHTRGFGTHFPRAGETPELSLFRRWAETGKKMTDLWWPTSLFQPDVMKQGRSPARIRAQILNMLLAYENVGRVYEANLAYDLERDLKRLQCPTLIIEIATPSEDGHIGRQGAALLSIIPGAQLLTIEEGAGFDAMKDSVAERAAKPIFDFLGG